MNPAGTLEARQQQTVIRLLTALVVLVGLLVLALTVTGILAMREYAKLNATLERSFGGNVQSVQATLERTRDVLDEVTARQAAAAAGLTRVAEQTEKRVAEFQRRRDALSGEAKGPLDKLAQMIRLMQVMVDEQMAMLQHFAGSQAELAEAMRPLPTQRALRRETRERERRGVGGSGDAERGPADDATKKPDAPKGKERPESK